MEDIPFSEITKLSRETVAEIRNVPHFRDSHYKTWDLTSLLASYTYGFVSPLQKLRPIDETVIISDIGTGYGWLAFAWVMHTPARVIAVDFDRRRVDAARAIGDILGVNDRIDWRVGSLGTLPLADRETDIACCIEVVEHVDRRPETIHDLARTSRDIVLLTTPNGALPVVFHDTSLPFCHFLPPRLRDFYAAVFGRKGLQGNNLFWTPGRLNRALPEFFRVSRFFQYQSYHEWYALSDLLRQYPIGGYDRTVRMQQAAYRLASQFGDRAYYVLPNLGAIWRRS